MLVVSMLFAGCSSGSGAGSSGGAEPPEDSPISITHVPSSSPRVPTPNVPAVLEDSFVNIRTGDSTPLPDGITSIPGAGTYTPSPDGTALLFWGRSQNPGGFQLFLANLDGTNVRQLTDDAVGAQPVGWSPDGSRIAYVAGPGLRDSGRDYDLVVMDVTTGSTTFVATVPAYEMQEPRFGPDGTTIVYRGYQGDIPTLDRKPTVREKWAAQPDLMAISIRGGQPTVLLEHGVSASWSPDGETTAFAVSFETPSDGLLGRGGLPNGHHEIWLAEADGSERRHLVNCIVAFGGPLWSPDGTHILCQGEDGLGREVVIVVDVASGKKNRLVVGYPAGWVDDVTLIVDAWRPPTPNP